MSFRLFIYYSALCGGWAGFVAWALGRAFRPDPAAHEVLAAGVRGLWLGLLIALGLGVVDALWNLSLRRILVIVARVGVAVAVGLVGGLAGGLLAQLLYHAGGIEGSFTAQILYWLRTPFYVLGWTLTGLLVGASVGVFELAVGLLRRQDLTGARKKLVKCLLGGTAGGLLGGILSSLLRGLWSALFHGRDPESLWSPTAMGFVALGVCIGLLIGLAQVLLKEAWIKVEAGFRVGREMILSKERTTVGRAESCDLGLFGDPSVEKLHAQIVVVGNRYHVEDGRTASGTYVNDQLVNGLVPLQSGDLIRVGKNLLRFGERQKRTR